MADSEIPEEIVTNILRRLPVKSLMRFQCVSPAWRVLIKSPFFRKMHVNQQKLLKNDGSSSSRSKEDEYILVLSSPQTEDGNVEFSFFTRGHGGELVPIQAPTAFPVFPHSKLELCAPCNGIFCAVAKIDEEEPSIYLCNPATRESRRLPYRPFGFQPEKFPRSGVSYVERAAWGFGLDPRTDEYKLFSVMYYGTHGDRYYFDFDGTDDPFDSLLASHLNGVLNHGIYQFEIYELGSNTWREVEVALPDTPGLVRRRKNESYVYSCDQWRGGGLFLNGCFYWLYTRRTILCFDICSETLQAIEPPFLFQQRVDLVVLGDSLALVAQVRGFPISIWVMEESGDDDSWVKRFRIAPYTIPLHPLHAWKDDDGDLLLFQADEPNNIETLVSCNGSVGAYHAYPIRALAERYLVLRAIVISDQTLVSVESTT